jgi:hypothetical protein
MSRRARDFWGQVYAAREGVEYGPFDIDLEKVLGWDDVFSYCQDELQGKYLELAQVVDKDADFVKPDTGEELDWDDFEWYFDGDETDEFFEQCYLAYEGYNWSKHDDLIVAYDSAGNDDDDTLEAIKAYLDNNCSPSDFGRAYRGSHRDGAAFAEKEYADLIEDREYLQYLVIDWEATWQGMQDYVEYGDGHFFWDI